ncbi:MAG: hypothetical protein RR410_04845 [Alistipes sp.]
MDQPLRKTDDVQFAEVRLNGVQTPDFVANGFGGTGAGLVRDTNGQTVLELDKLVVRRNLSVNELRINQVTYVGGRQIMSAAGITVSRVEESATAYRCHFDTHSNTIANLFALNDQAYCQRYGANNASVIKYYWRLVTAVGLDYIDLAKSDCDGTGIPTEGDVIVQIGNRTDSTRQSILEIDQLNGGKLVQYAGINSYSFANKNYMAFGVDHQTGKGYFYVYGDAFIGDRDLTDPNATFMTFQTPAGASRPRLVVQADLHIGAGSTGLKNLSEWVAVQKQINLSATAANEAKDRLNKWADDAVISPTEKAALRSERTSVAGEKEIVVANAAACKVSTVDFLASWNLYDAELVYHSTAAPENIPIRPAFATTQSGYYAAKKAIAAQITAAQQQATIGNTEAASAATKDALAKELGYTDFATMKAAAAADKTIIDGGHLRTALIDVDNLVAKQVDVVNGASRVKITPELGLILLENNIETATFSGEQASSINSIVPEVASIPITEQHIVIRSTNMDVEPGGRRYMASGSIARTSNALVVEIPAITLYSALYCSNNHFEPNPIRGWMQIRINGGVAKEMQFVSQAFDKKSFQNGFDQEGYPIYEDRYLLNQVNSRSFPAQSISIPAKTASSTSAPITVEFSYGFFRGQAGDVSWDIDLYAKFGNNPAANAPMTTNLKIGGTAFNASFFGNGVLFSKAIDQYVGMLSTPTGTELIARNGNRGFKFDGAGISMLKEDGATWDNSGVLCAYNIDVDGGINNRFGVKDKGGNSCFRYDSGVYRVYHHLGTTDYVASATVAAASWAWPCIVTKAAEFVEIQMFDPNGHSAFLPFTVTIYGAY